MLYVTFGEWKNLSSPTNLCIYRLSIVCHMFLLWYIFAKGLCQNRKALRQHIYPVRNSDLMKPWVLNLFSNTPWNNRFFFGEGLLYSPHSSKLGDSTEGFSSPKIGDLIRFNFSCQRSWAANVDSKITPISWDPHHFSYDNWHFVGIFTPFLEKIQMPPMTLVGCIPMFDPYPFVRCSFLQTETCMFYLRQPCSIFPMQRPLFLFFFFA